MDLPFYVYTARNGYAWIGADQTNRSLLDGFLKAIGRMPDFDMGEPARRGVLNVGSNVVIYRFMLHKKADSKGRDAVYLALTHLPANESAKVDIDHLLQTAPFTEPQTTPPIKFLYHGPPPSSANFRIPDTASAGTFDNTGSLASCGSLFSDIPEGRLHIIVEETTPHGPAHFRYSLDAPKPPPEHLVKSPPPISLPLPSPSLLPNNNTRKLLLTILLGLIIMWAVLQIKKIWPQNQKSQKPQTNLTPVSLEKSSGILDEDTSRATSKKFQYESNKENLSPKKIDSTRQIDEDPHHE
jgi:hypothetical protein